MKLQRLVHKKHQRITCNLIQLYVGVNEPILKFKKKSGAMTLHHRTRYIEIPKIEDQRPRG